MMKVAGGFLVIGATTLAGIRKASGLKQEYRQMELLHQLICRIQSEIRYARSPLGEIFLHIGRYEKEPYRSWLTGLGKKMEEHESGLFDGLWKQSIQEKLWNCGLPERELQRLSELGSRLGFSDIELQVKTLELYLLQLSGAMEEAQGAMKTKLKLCYCLGIMSGLLIVTLLL